MRTLLLTLIVFVLAGLSLSLTRYDLSGLKPQFLAEEEPTLSFEVRPTGVAEEDRKTISVHRARPDGVLLLSPSTKTQTARYALPREAGLVSGVLELKVAAQVSENNQDLLRISIGNQTRGEVLLRPGLNNIETAIGLTADDLASETLAIRYTLLTEEASPGACSTAGSFPSVVEIEQDSKITLHVENAKLSPGDKVAASGNEVLIGWPHWLSEEQRRERWASAMQLAMRGFEVRLIDAPDSVTLSGNALKELVASDDKPIALDEAEHVWPEHFSKGALNTGKRTFQRSAAWRHWYRFGPEGHQSAPSELEYDMMLGPLPSHSNWTVIITHNGSILEVAEVPGNIGRLKGNIKLDDVEIEQSNLVEITATSGYQPTGLCNNGPELFAEMRAETRLLGGGAEYQDTVAPLTQELTGNDPFTVALPLEMSLVEAQRMLALVTEVAPPDASMRLVADKAMISGVRRELFETLDRDAPEGALVVWYDETKWVHVQEAAILGTEDWDTPVGALAIIVDPQKTVHSASLELQ